jgi:hypothetical protein
MKKRGLLGAVALLAGVGAFGAPMAQGIAPSLLDEWQRDWTVVTMAPDGAWGVATDMYMIKALATAVDQCTAMTERRIDYVGCGSHFTTIRAGWTVGLRCGERNIISAEPSLDDAVKRANWREYELRRLYDPDMPRCERVMTVDPSGQVIAPEEREH